MVWSSSVLKESNHVFIGSQPSSSLSTNMQVFHPLLAAPRPTPQWVLSGPSCLSGMTYPPTAPRSGDTVPGASPIPVNMQRRGENWTPPPNIPSNDRENPQGTYHATTKSLRCWNRRGKPLLVNYTQVDIKSKEYKVATG